MPVVLTTTEREELEREAERARLVRHWRRWQAILRLDAGESVAAIAGTLDVGESTVRAWQRQWRDGGAAGLRERPRSGAPRRVSTPIATLLQTWLAGSPLDYGITATNWTIAALGTMLVRNGTPVSPSTLRRTLKRLGYRWKRPKYILNRPDPAHAEKKGAW